MKITAMAHHYASLVLKEGDIAVDATAGNGYDTLFLARQVGPRGRIYAFDIQEESLKRTAAVLEQNKVRDRVRLLKSGHERMADHIHEAVSVVMFNLGYLPGGDHRIVTVTGTTLVAMQAALGLLAGGGLVTAVVYPGHPAGKEEHKALLNYCRALNSGEYKVILITNLNQVDLSPALILIYKR